MPCWRGSAYWIRPSAAWPPSPALQTTPRPTGLPSHRPMPCWRSPMDWLRPSAAWLLRQCCKQRRVRQAPRRKGPCRVGEVLRNEFAQALCDYPRQRCKERNDCRAYRRKGPCRVSNVLRTDLAQALEFDQNCLRGINIFWANYYAMKYGSIQCNTIRCNTI